MSFYGNVFYEFKHLFFRFKFTNNNTDNIDLKAQDSVIGAVANSRQDTFYFKGGNRWIGMQSLEETDEEKGVVLFHNSPGEGKHEIYPLSIAAGNESEGIQLQSSQILNIPTIKYDNAGHISATENIAYKMPNANSVVYEGLENNFDDNFDLSIINPNIPDNIENTTILSPGQIIAIPKLNISNKGILNNFEETYYMLPASDAEKDYNELQQRMDIAETHIDNLWSYLQNYSYQELDSRIGKAEEDIVNNLQYCNDEFELIKSNYATLQHTGLIDDLYDNTSLILDENKFTSLTNALGNLETSAKMINVNNAGKSVSVSEQLMAIQQFALDQAGAYNISNTLFTNELQNLKDRVSLLEEKIN